MAMQSTRGSAPCAVAGHLPPPMPGSWFARQGEGGLHCGRLHAQHTLKQPAGQGLSARTSSRAHSPSSCRAEGLLESLLETVRQSGAAHTGPSSFGRSRASPSVILRPSEQDRWQRSSSSNAPAEHMRNPDVDSFPCSGSEANRYTAGSDSWSAARAYGRPARPCSAQRNQRMGSIPSSDAWPSSSTRTESKQQHKPERINAPDKCSAPFARQSDMGMPFGAQPERPASASSFVPSRRQQDLSSSASPEEAALVALTIADGKGVEEVRRVFRGLLLKWHPDKAPPAQHAEATRVMRFLLDQRSWLGRL